MRMNATLAQEIAPRPVGAGARLAASTGFWLLSTHALVYFLHEYSHATVAWMLGFMASPFAIDYGPLTAANFLLQQGVGDNVDYSAIFSGGHDFAAAVIALAGPGIGNALLYVVCRFAVVRVRSARPLLRRMLFWLGVMAAGNVWSYAPIRTITSHGDMGIIAKGMGVSGWVLFPFVTIPSIWIVGDCLTRMMPLSFENSEPSASDGFALEIALSCFVIFGFFGLAAIGGNYGDVSAVFSIVSLFFVLPLALAAFFRPRIPVRA